MAEALSGDLRARVIDDMLPARRGVRRRNGLESAQRGGAVGAALDQRTGSVAARPAAAVVALGKARELLSIGKFRFENNAFG